MTFIGLQLHFACNNKKSEELQIEYLDLTPLGFFDELKHNIFLTEAKITADSGDIFFSVGHQGLIVRTDSLLNLVSYINGRDKYPDFDFPGNLTIKGDTLFVEDLSYQRLFLLDKNDFNLIDIIKFPFLSMGIGMDISKSNKLLYSFFPEQGKTGLAWINLKNDHTESSKDFIPQMDKLRINDQIRLGCFCEEDSLWSIGRFLPILEKIDEQGYVEHSFDLLKYEPLKRAYDSLISKREKIPDFESSNISQNIITSLECFGNKFLVGFTDLIGLDRSNVRHLLLFSYDNERISLEKILRLRTGNEDEMFHFQTVKYNPKTSLLYAQGFESNKIYVFKLRL
jgi:hypothetical protein